MEHKAGHQNRRKFLGLAGKGVLASSFLSSFPAPVLATDGGASGSAGEPISVTLPPLDDLSEQELAPLPSMIEPSQRIGYCIVGLGHLSLGQILPAFAKSGHARPVALVSGDASKAAKVAAQYGIKPTGIYDYKNFERIKDNREIDIVYIVLPNSMHEEYVIRAARAGKHVLCEKPMTTSPESAQRMIDACKAAGKKLMIAYRIQYEPFNKIAMQWTRNAEFGKVKIIESFNSQHIGDPSQWRLKKALSGGGALPDIGLYNLNTSRYLLGEEPEWVSAHVYSTPGDARFREVEETVLFQLGFASGALASATTSYGVHQSRKYRCLTDKGAWFGLEPAFSYNGLRLERSQAKGMQEYRQQVVMGEKDQFALEIDHMANCVIKDLLPFTPGEEGLQDQKIMEAVYRSADSGRPVQLEKITRSDAFRGSRPEDK